MSGIIFGSMQQSLVQQVRYEGSKQNFHIQGGSTVRSACSKYEKELKVALKQKREPNSALTVG